MNDDFFSDYHKTIVLKLNIFLVSKFNLNYTEGLWFS